MVTLNCWFHKFRIIKWGCRMGLSLPTQKSERGKIRPLGCRELRAPTWRSLTSLYAARPPRRAARIGALINFIAPPVQAVWVSVQSGEVISAVSSSPAATSDYQIFVLAASFGAPQTAFLA